MLDIKNTFMVTQSDPAWLMPYAKYLPSSECAVPLKEVVPSAESLFGSRKT